MIGILRRLKNLIPVNARLLLYKSVILPRLTYCHLERLVYNTAADSYDTLLKRAKLTTLQNRRLQDILILMFKVKNKFVMNYISDIFNIREEDTNGKRYNLSNADFVLPRFKTVSYGKHSLRFLGPQLWAKLCKEERSIDTLAAFSKMIRKKDVTSIVEGYRTECRLRLG